MRHRAMIVSVLLVLAAAAAATLPAAAADSRNSVAVPAVIQVTGGVADFQVLPRDNNDRAAAHMLGRCYPTEGAIEARLCDRGAPMPDLDWRQVGAASDGKWTADLRELPVGGPYDLEVRLVSADGEPLATTAMRSVLVGDLWILAGQSNMQGVGLISELPPPIAAVSMFAMDDRWALGREPLHPLLESVDEVHWQVPKEKTREEVLPGFRQGVRAREARGVGPGLPFAWELYRLTGVPIGLIPCAHGGTSLQQWSPERKDEGGRSLYGAMIRRAAAAGGKIRGVLWYQGESDANPDAAGTYQQRFTDFVAAARRDLGEPDLCFLYVQIGRFIVPADGLAAAWDRVREAQRLAEAQLGRAAVVPALDGTLIDLIHLDTAAQMTVGRRLALQAAREVFGREAIRRGPRLAEVTIDSSRRVVTLRFAEVNGALRAEGRPLGFSLDDGTGADIPAIVRTDLPAERPDTIELRLARELPEGARLWYGRGLDPCVNVTDEQNLGMLAFGPVPIPFPAE